MRLHNWFWHWPRATFHSERGRQRRRTPSETGTRSPESPSVFAADTERPEVTSSKPAIEASSSRKDKSKVRTPADPVTSQPGEVRCTDLSDNHTHSSPNKVYGKQAEALEATGTTSTKRKRTLFFQESVLLGDDETELYDNESPSTTELPRDHAASESRVSDTSGDFGAWSLNGRPLYSSHMPAQDNPQPQRMAGSVASPGQAYPSMNARSTTTRDYLDASSRTWPPNLQLGSRSWLEAPTRHPSETIGAGISSTLGVTLWGQSFPTLPESHPLFSYLAPRLTDQEAATLIAEGYPPGLVQLYRRLVHEQEHFTQVQACGITPVFKIGAEGCAEPARERQRRREEIMPNPVPVVDLPVRDDETLDRILAGQGKDKWLEQATTNEAGASHAK